jgi:hypothetical protein
MNMYVPAQHSPVPVSIQTYQNNDRNSNDGNRLRKEDAPIPREHASPVGSTFPSPARCLSVLSLPVVLAVLVAGLQLMMLLVMQAESG